MTLQSSGRIDLSDVNLELKIADSSVTSTSYASLVSSKIRTLAGKPSGRVAMSDLYGKSSHVPTLKTVYFNAGISSWTRPAGVTVLETLMGRGGTGDAPVPGTPQTSTYPVDVAYVGVLAAIPPTGQSVGNYSWNIINNVVQQGILNLNNNNQDTIPTKSVNQYVDNTYTEFPNGSVQVPHNVSQRVPGSARGDYDAGWQMSGDIGGPTPAGYSGRVVYDYYTGGVSGGSPGTTGGTTTFANFSWPGGVGGQAAESTMTSVQLSASSYSINVAPGGYLQLQFYE